MVCKKMKYNITEKNATYLKKKGAGVRNMVSASNVFVWEGR